MNRGETVLVAVVRVPMGDGVSSIHAGDELTGCSAQDTDDMIE
jgi:hypothetical protein